MLYHIHEFNHHAMTPMRMMAQAVNMLATNPLLPTSHTGLGRTVAAGTDVFERITRKYPKPDFGLAETVVDGQLVGVRERIVEHKPFCNLIHFERDLPEERDDPAVLVVAALSGHYATLMRGTVQALLPEHEVYITDWLNARDVALWHGEFDMASYVNYLIEFMEVLGPDTSMLAVCQPGVPVLCANALMSEDDNPNRPNAMVLMGSPIDTRMGKTAVNLFAESKDMSWFRRRFIQTVPAPYMGAGRSVYPGFLQLGGFMAMNVERHMDAHRDYFNHLVEGDGDSAAAHRKFYDEYLSVMDMPAAFYLETIERVFKEHHLPEGRMMIGDRLVKPEAITDVGLMTVEGEKDDITGLGQTEAAHGMLTGLSAKHREHMVCPGVGHYGIFNGRRWREMILPRVATFIRAQRAQRGFGPKARSQVFGSEITTLAEARGLGQMEVAPAAATAVNGKAATGKGDGTRGKAAASSSKGTKRRTIGESAPEAVGVH
ncbi:polyhydroxyalkanoate depolymerase [Rhodospira trueperi]|uniref:Poly(3-hydroxybutyrate) depolymerase n=1 Tax=Rhodospira trueperi TaxID=69960 RepID=A0A1G6Z3M0_9PROT|nr:poly(3-hydroxybutyrate) depolymerase [Rhodospira trueperi]